MLQLVHDMFLFFISKLIDILFIASQKRRRMVCKRRRRMVCKKKKKDGVQQKKKDDVQPQVLVEKCDNIKGVNMEPQECNVIMSFTQLLTALW
jgi:hypothetical protein